MAKCRLWGMVSWPNKSERWLKKKTKKKNSAKNFKRKFFKPLILYVRNKICYIWVNKNSGETAEKPFTVLFQ